MIGIVPGATESGFAVVEDGALVECGYEKNARLLARIELNGAVAVVMPRSEAINGPQVLTACFWAGRFVQAAKRGRAISLAEVAEHIAGRPHATREQVQRAVEQLRGADKYSEPIYAIAAAVSISRGKRVRA